MNVRVGKIIISNIVGVFAGDIMNKDGVLRESAKFNQFSYK